MRYPQENYTWLCSELVTFSYQSGVETHETTANLEEISPSLAVLLIDGTCEDGGLVSFIVQGHRLSGCVQGRSCDPLLGCFVTVELDSSSQWSEAWFKPEHLIRAAVLPCVEASAA